MKLLRTVGPWAVALGILAVLFVRIDPGATLDALRMGDLRAYVPVACVFVGLWLAIDAHILGWLFSRIAAPISWAEMARMRGATYPAMAISFDLASAALVASVRRATGVPLSRVAGGMMLHYLGDLTALATVAFVASLAVDSAVFSVLRPVLGAIALGLAATLLAGRLGRGILSGRRVVEALCVLSLPEIVRLVASRAFFYASFILFAWITLPTFGIRVALLDVGARMPLVLSVAALPVAPAGIGTAQAAMVVLFGEFASAAQVFAYALVYTFTLIALRVPLGFALWLVPAGSRHARENGVTS